MAEQAELNEQGELVKPIEEKKESFFNKLKPKKEIDSKPKTKEISLEEFESMKKLVYSRLTLEEIKEWYDLKLDTVLTILVSTKKELESKCNHYEELVSKLKQ